MSFAGLSELPRGVAAAIVREDFLDDEPVALEEAQRLFQERHGRRPFLVGQDLDVGQTAGVVDGYVGVFLARPSILTRPVPSGSVTRSRAPTSERLAVEVDEFARNAALVAVGHRLRPWRWKKRSACSKNATAVAPFWSGRTST